MIGNIMRELRNSKGLTIQKAAEVFGVAPRTYSSYESEEREPNITLLNKIADFYGVSVDCLLGREAMPDPLPLLVARTNVSIEELEKQFNALPSEGKALMMTIIRMLKNNRETSNKE